jgi:hypothetical protein
MTKKDLEKKIRCEVQDAEMREKFITLIFQGFKINRILEMLDDYKKVEGD